MKWKIIFFIVFLSIMSGLYLNGLSKGKDEKKIANRLINEKNPYLLQHAHNPVNWFPLEKKLLVKRRMRTSLFSSLLVILPVIGVMSWKKNWTENNCAL